MKFLTVVPVGKSPYSNDKGHGEFYGWDDNGRAWVYHQGEDDWNWYRADYMDHPQACGSNQQHADEDHLSAVVSQYNKDKIEAKIIRHFGNFEGSGKIGEPIVIRNGDAYFVRPFPGKRGHLRIGGCTLTVGCKEDSFVMKIVDTSTKGEFKLSSVVEFEFKDIEDLDALFTQARRTLNYPVEVI